jgi:hypothetical protein
MTAAGRSSPATEPGISAPHDPELGARDQGHDSRNRAGGLEMRTALITLVMCETTTPLTRATAAGPTKGRGSAPATHGTIAGQSRAPPLSATRSSARWSTLPRDTAGRGGAGGHARALQGLRDAPGPARADAPALDVDRRVPRRRPGNQADRRRCPRTAGPHSPGTLSDSAGGLGAISSKR